MGDESENKHNPVFGTPSAPRLAETQALENKHGLYLHLQMPTWHLSPVFLGMTGLFTLHV